jgi:hypothetical protein
MNPEKAFYLLKHFEHFREEDLSLFQGIGKSRKDVIQQTEMIGSKFHDSYCSSPFLLPYKLNEGNIILVIDQDETKLTKVFSFSEHVGTDALMPLNELNKSQTDQLKTEIRAETEIRFLDCDELQKTHLINLVEDKNTGDWITCFPGRYAPPLPHPNQPLKQQLESSTFWDQHIFLRKQ